MSVFTSSADTDKSHREVGHFSRIFAKISFLCEVGPLFLVGTLTVALFKTSMMSALPLFFSLPGIWCIRKWRRTGLFLSLGCLAFVIIVLMWQGQEPLWLTLLFCTISGSWYLVLLGERQALDVLHRLEEILLAMRKKGDTQEQMFLEEQKALLQEKSALSDALHETRLKVEALEEQKARLHSDQTQQIATLTEQLFCAQHDMQLKQWQHRYLQLREQFQEKTEALQAARQEAFQHETLLLQTQKVAEEERVGVWEEELLLLHSLQEMEEECKDLHLQVDALQTSLSMLLLQKKENRARSTKAKKKEKEEGQTSFFS